MPDLELSRRAVACTHWKWWDNVKMPVWTDRWGRKGELKLGWCDLDELEDGITILPDLDNPMVLGWLLHLVRVTRNAPRAFVRLSGDDTSYHVFDPDRAVGYCPDRASGYWCCWLSPDLPTEAEALVAALEAT